MVQVLNLNSGSNNQTLGGWSGAGPDPGSARRERMRRYQLWLQQQQAMQNGTAGQRPYQPQRGGAQPPPSASSAPMQPMSAMQPMAMSPTSDALDEWSQQGQTPAQVQVEPNLRRGVMNRGPYANAQALRASMEQRVSPGAVVDPNVSSANSDAFSQQEPIARAQAHGQLTQQRLAGHRREQRAGRILQFEQANLSGPASGLGAQGLGEFEAFKRGELRIDQLRSPAAIRAGRALYAQRGNPQLAATVDRYTQEGQARVNAVNPETGLSANDKLAQAQGKGMYRSPSEKQAEVNAASAAHKQSVRELAAQRREERNAAIERFGTDRPMAVGALKQEREARRDQLDLANKALDVQGMAAGAKANAKSGQMTEAQKMTQARWMVENGHAPDLPSAMDDIDAMQIARQNRGSGQAVGPAEGDTIDPTIWEQTLDAPSSASVAGLWRRSWGTQSDTEQEFEGKMASFESQIDDLEGQSLNDEQKRRVAQAILAQMPAGWLGDYSGKFGERKRKLHQRLVTLARHQRGQPKRASAQPAPSTASGTGRTMPSSAGATRQP